MGNMPDDMFVKRLPVDPNGHLLHHLHMTATVSKLPGGELHVYGEQTYCYHCGRRLRYRLNGDMVQAAGDGQTFSEPCQFPNGLTTTTTIRVPSGQMIVADDLRPVYGDFNETRFAPYDTAYGSHQVIEAYAAQGCAYGPVLNTSPTLYQTGMDTFVIASVPYDDDINPVVPQGWAARAWIVTDLWAYSIADYDDWKDRCGDDVDHYKDRLGHWSVVDVYPGSYEFTYHGGEAGFDYHGDGVVVFANIRRL